jgi:conjugal transfer pilus assembly protein TraD
MTGAAGEPRRPPYWTVVALAGLILVPPVWAAAALIAAATGLAALSAARRVARRRAATREAGAEAVALGSGVRGEPIELSDRQLSAHALILGASGSGKSTTLLTILTDQIRRGRPVVAIDMKGSPAFARALADAAAGAGRPFRAWTPDGPGQWNPLAHGNATELKDKLIATERFTEPHYQRAAERYVQTVLQVLEHAHPGRAPTLAEVVDLMEPRRMSTILRRLPAPFAVRVQDYVATLSSDQLSAIRGLGTRLAILTESHTGAFLSPAPGADAGAIDLRDALAGSPVVLFSLNSSRYGKLSAQLGTLAIQDLVAAVGHRLDLPPQERATIGIDEFSALGADHVVSLLARAREAGVTVLLATQELADLDRAAPGLRDQVLGNTAVKLVHRQDVPASAQTIAQMAGTEKTWEETRQVSGRIGRYETGRGTRRLAEQFVVHPNEIKSLPTGHAVLITKLPSAQARTVRVNQPARRGADGREAAERRAPAPGERGGPEL